MSPFSPSASGSSGDRLTTHGIPLTAKFETCPSLITAHFGGRLPETYLDELGIVTCRDLLCLSVKHYASSLFVLPHGG